jgi:hypothetical protein
LTILLPRESTSPTREQKEREKEEKRNLPARHWAENGQKKEMKLNHKPISDQGGLFFQFCD